MMWQLEGIPMIVQGVYSEDPQAQLEATTQFRKLLSIGKLYIFFLLSECYMCVIDRHLMVVL